MAIYPKTYLQIFYNAKLFRYHNVFATYKHTPEGTYQCSHFRLSANWTTVLS
jgi:hypothetical protein